MSVWWWYSMSVIGSGSGGDWWWALSKTKAKKGKEWCSSTKQKRVNWVGDQRLTRPSRTEEFFFSLFFFLRWTQPKLHLTSPLSSSIYHHHYHHHSSVGLVSTKKWKRERFIRSQIRRTLLDDDKGLTINSQTARLMHLTTAAADHARQSSNGKVMVKRSALVSDDADGDEDDDNNKSLQDKTAVIWAALQLITDDCFRKKDAITRLTHWASVVRLPEENNLPYNLSYN